ncbi:MAG TPA: GntR family transcriptional regulator [Devosiaceae bacterium]|jgi:DNA-binding GntR family transcriptional regulator|nr:GntR family transcriptional regulator [Devosiaceae bacterium]
MVTKELIRSGTTVDALVRAIADDIVSARLQPGARLDESSLALRYAVSRTPVREALVQLSAMGLIDRRPNRGAMVAQVSDEYLHAMFEAMTELEAICARLSAQRMTTAERRELEAVHQAAMRLVHLGAEEEYSAYNIDFHNRLYEGAHNAHILELVAQTRSRLGPFRRAQFRIPGRLAKSWQEHDAIVTAVLRGDAAAAEAAARAHVGIVSDASSEFVHGAREGSRNQV